LLKIVFYRNNIFIIENNFKNFMSWSVNQSIRDLKIEIRYFYVAEANYLFQELRRNKLKVILAPAPNPNHQGHMIRIIENKNPQWYRDLYHSSVNFRRDLSFKSLDRIRNQRDITYKVSSNGYDLIYRNLIHERLTIGYKEVGHIFPPNNLVRSYHELPTSNSNEIYGLNKCEFYF